VFLPADGAERPARAARQFVLLDKHGVWAGLLTDVNADRGARHAGRRITDHCHR
jgi:hypothetical protein